MECFLCLGVYLRGPVLCNRPTIALTSCQVLVSYCRAISPLIVDRMAWAPAWPFHKDERRPTASNAKICLVQLAKVGHELPWNFPLKFRSRNQGRITTRLGLFDVDCRRLHCSIDARLYLFTDPFNLLILRACLIPTIVPHQYIITRSYTSMKLFSLSLLLASVVSLGVARDYTYVDLAHSGILDDFWMP